MLKDLKEKGVEILTSTKLCGVSAEGVKCETPQGEILIGGIDKVVVAIGSRPHGLLKEEMESQNYEVVTIGDARRAGKAYVAIEEGARAALQI